jgi:hypothetical protein
MYRIWQGNPLPHPWNRRLCMDNLVAIFEGILILGLVAAGLAIVLFPLRLDIQYMEETGKHLLNFWLTALEIIAIINLSSYLNDGNEADYDFAIGFFTLVCIAVAIFTARKAKRLKLVGFQKFIMIAAQLLSPLSIFFILFLISMVTEKLNEKDKKD